MKKTFGLSEKNSAFLTNTSRRHSFPFINTTHFPPSDKLNILPYVAFSFSLISIKFPCNRIGKLPKSGNMIGPGGEPCGRRDWNRNNVIITTKNAIKKTEFQKTLRIKCIFDQDFNRCKKMWYDC